MNSRMKTEGLLFTLFVGAVMLSALWFARDWPIRASIGVYALGGIGVVLAIWQIVLDARRPDGPQARQEHGEAHPPLRQRRDDPQGPL